jgi:hypothetical protein
VSVEKLDNAVGDLGDLGPLLKRAEEIRDEVHAFKAETGEQSADTLKRISDLEVEQSEMPASPTSTPSSPPQPTSRTWTPPRMPRTS